MQRRIDAVGEGAVERHVERHVDETRLLTGVDLKSTIEDIMLESAEGIAAQFADERTLPEDWDWSAISDAVFQQFSNQQRFKKAEAIHHERFIAVISFIQFTHLRDHICIAQAKRQFCRFNSPVAVFSLYKSTVISGCRKR